MIISTPEELRLYLSTHVIDNMDSVRGAIDNSEHDFLRERIGAPLLKKLAERYVSDYIIDDVPNLDAIAADILSSSADKQPWPLFISLCQRCVVFDAFARLAEIQAVSVNDAGINVVETKGYDAAPDKVIDKYKSRMSKEAHAAANRLLIQLEEWQQAVAQIAEGATLLDDKTDIREIVTLWKQSPFYYYADGLLFNTATEFNRFVDIYESREKFIQLLPDIRYCQETQLETELGEELLADLIDKRRSGKWNSSEERAYKRLQRTLSLMVEARNPMFKRPAAADEAVGQLHLVLDFMRKNQTEFDADAMRLSPLYVAAMWPDAEESATDTESGEAQRHHCHPEHHKGHCPHDSGGMLISTMI